MRKNLKSAVTRILAAMLMLAMVVTVVPVPAEAAAKPYIAMNGYGGCTLYVGASIQLKIKGKYKKVYYKARNKNISVSRTGKVTEKNQRLP